MWLYEIHTGSTGESFERVYVSIENEDDAKAFEIFYEKTGIKEPSYFEKFKLVDGFCSDVSDCGIEIFN